MLLLHLMHLVFPQRVRAIYIDHQLQKDSAEWGQFVQQQCQLRQVSCHIVQVNVAEGNLEQQARQARYSAYRQYLEANDILVLAHHQQDQAETALLRLLSGTGVQGLMAMKSIDHRPDMQIWRPLLDISRVQIQAWATQLQIPHIEDPTNQDTHYDRAWSREILWPLLESRFPKMQQAISRTSVLMQDAYEILEDVLQQDMQSCIETDIVNLASLSQLSRARKRQLLSVWMKGEGNYRPSFETIARLQHEVIDAKVDAKAALHHQGFYYVRYKNKLYRISEESYQAQYKIDTVSSQKVKFALNQQLNLLSGQYHIVAEAQVGLDPQLLEQDLTLELRQGGERIHLYGRVGNWPLKKAIQDAQIFPWARHTIQILSRDNVMLGVFTPKGFWLAQSSYCQLGGWLPTLTLKNSISSVKS